MEEDGDVHAPAISTSISEDEYVASCMATLRHNGGDYYLAKSKQFILLNN